MTLIGTEQNLLPQICADERQIGSAGELEGGKPITIKDSASLAWNAWGALSQHLPQRHGEDRNFAGDRCRDRSAGHAALVDRDVFG
jgi:hypothetical protein